MVDTTYFKSRMTLEMSIRSWIANQKFWTSVILLGLCVIVIRIIYYPALIWGFAYNMLLWYTLIGGLIWSGYANKKGMSLITLGVVIALLVLVPFNTILAGGTFHLEGYVILIVEIVLSVVFFWMGTRRYNNWKIKNQETVS